MEKTHTNDSIQHRLTGKVAVIVLNYNNWNDTVACLESVFSNNYEDMQIILVDNGSTDDSWGQIKKWAAAAALIAGKIRPIPCIAYNREIAEAGGLRTREKELTAALPAGVPCPLVLIQSGSNLGYAGGNNVGIKYALHSTTNYSCAWLLNNDTIVAADALSHLVTEATRDLTVGIVGSKILFYDHPGIIQAAGGAFLFPFLAHPFYRSHGKPDGACSRSRFGISYIMGASMLIKMDVFGNTGLFESGYFLG